MKRGSPSLYALCLSILTLVSPVARAQDSRTSEGIEQPRGPRLSSASHFGTSPFPPPEQDDKTFVVDQDVGLDTGCSFRSEGPLVFTIRVGRVVGDVAKLKLAGMISETAGLKMPAYDVDSGAQIPGINPERDRLSFNGHVVPKEFLEGLNDTWVQNSFTVPIEWVNFAADPGPGGTPRPGENVIRIDIDVANAGEEWCTSIDWAALSIEVSRPVVMVHGIFSDGGVWTTRWVPELDALGLPSSNRLDMGNLDGIASNAAKIAAEVANARQRWGVDKVNLVCHSKGGLDARHYAETSDSVDRVIQIGTPNAGSPLADVVQAGMVDLTGALGAVLVNALAGPAGLQLTTAHMSFYNMFHRGNSSVRYTSLAGEYDPDCFILNPLCRPIDRLLLALTGPGDTIVPLSSAHALDWVIDKPLFRSRGDDGQAKHTLQTGSSGIYADLLHRVQSFSKPAASVTSVASARTATVTGVIAQGQVQTHTLALDQPASTLIALLYPSGNLNLRLTSPSGRVFDETTVDPNVLGDEGDVPGGRMEAYNFAALEVGVWTAQISAPLVTEPSGSVSYALNGWLQNPSTQFTAHVFDPNVSVGETLELVGTLQEDGGPLTGATVSALVALPDNTLGHVSLNDNGTGRDVTPGDGTYTGEFTNTSAPGIYRIVFTGSGAGLPGHPAFSREDFGLATVASSASRLQGTFRDFGLDTNGNGLFDELVVEVDLDVSAQARYRVFGELSDTAGNRQPSSVEAVLASGPHTISLRFDGRRIFNNHVNGPYTLAEARLAEISGEDIFPLDVESNGTAPYDYRAFEHGAVYLDGTGSTQGVDTNGNGLFDELYLQVGAVVEAAGVYSWSAHLADINGFELGLAAGSAAFSAGSNTMQLVFAGEPIGQNGVDGPFFLRDLLLYGAGESLIAALAFTTEPLLASQFEGFTPPITTTMIALNDLDQGVGVDQMLKIPDPQTGAAVLVGSLGLNFSECEAMAVDPATSEIYVADNDRLLEVDPTTGNGTLIGAIGYPGLGGLAFQPQTGLLFGVTYGSNKILQIDTATGAGTVVASNVLSGHRLNDLAFHPDGRAFVLTDDTPPKLYQVDIATGTKLNRWILSGGTSLEALAWSPDGTRLYSAADRGAFKDLVTIDLATSTISFASPEHSGFDDIEALAWVSSRVASLLTAWSPTGVENLPPQSRRALLMQNVPNPFNPTTRIDFDLPQASEVELSVYDVAGRKVITLLKGRLEKGRHRANWYGQREGGQRVAAGVYNCVLRGAHFEETRCMVLIK